MSSPYMHSEVDQEALYLGFSDGDTRFFVLKEHILDVNHNCPSSS